MPTTQKSFLSLLVVALSATSLSAQDASRLLSKNQLATLKSQEPLRLLQAKERLMGQRSQVGLSEDHTFQLRGSHLDVLGQTHGRFDQYYRGVKVWGAQTITHTAANGTALRDSSHLEQGITLNTTPTVPVAEALALVHQSLRPHGAYAFQPQVELVIYPESEKVVHRIISKPGEALNAYDIQQKLLRYHLAYHVHVGLENSQDGLVRRDFLIDAHDASLLQDWNTLKTEIPTGTGNSQYSGTVALNITPVPGGYELRDTHRGTQPNPYTGEVGNIVYAGNKSTGLPGDPGVSVYHDRDNTWGDGTNYTWSNSQLSANGQTAAVDAAYGAQVTWDLFNNVFSRNGIDGHGTSTFSVVHYNDTGDSSPNVNMINASWDDNCFCMRYMDGFIGTYGSQSFSVTSVTALDVAGHEMSHGVCYSTADLIYKNESGGLNESNSDIFGTMAEFYSKGGGYGNQTASLPDTGGNWTLGEQIDTQGTPLRWMYRPSLDGQSPDAWFSGIGSLNVHYSSGPMNRAFALLSHGSGSADWASTPSVTGIGNTKAAHIWYHALASYLYPSSDYAHARQYAIRAAVDLYPTEPTTIQAVRDAFAAISVGDSAGTGDDVVGPVVTLSGGGTSGTINFTATASDSNGVASVAFVIDGVRFSSLSSAPYTATLDSTQYLNGPHTVIAEAIDTNNNHTISNSVNITLNNASQQLFLNPGFEGGPVVWAPTAGVIQEGKSTSSTARSGQYIAWLAGNQDSKEHTETIAQPVTIPSTGQNITLSAYLKIKNTQTTTSPLVTWSLMVWDMSGNAIATLRTLSNTDAATYADWTQFTNDLSAYRGHTLLVGFQAHEPATPLETSFFMDDAAITVTGTATNPGPTITTEPLPQTASINGIATFTCQATATSGSLSYQWQYSSNGTSWTNVSSGGTSATLTLSPVAATQNGYYRVQITDGTGTINSMKAQLTTQAASKDLWFDDTIGDVLDLAMFARAMGRNSTDPAWSTKYKAADLNGDSQVDDADLTLFLTGF